LGFTETHYGTIAISLCYVSQGFVEGDLARFVNFFRGGGTLTSHEYLS